MAAIDFFVNSIYSALVAWTYLLLVILLFVKIIQLIQSFGGFGRGRGDRDPGDVAERNRQERERAERERAQGGAVGPQQVQGFEGRMNP